MGCWAVLFAAKCFRCTVRVPSICLGKSLCRGLLFFGLNSFLTYSCAGELQLPGCTAKCFQCTVRVLSIFFGLNSFLTYSCVGELQSPGCTVCCQVPPSVLSSVFFQGVTSDVKSISSSSGFPSHSIYIQDCISSGTYR